MATNKDALDAGAKFTITPGVDPLTDPQNLRYSNAFYKAVLGSDKTGGGVGYGSFFNRVPVTLTGVTVTTNVATPALPGAVLSVQATTGSSLGVKTIMTVGPVIAGSCLITQDSNGRDKIEFAAADAVTVCAFRQIQMNQAMFDALKETTVPA